MAKAEKAHVRIGRRLHQWDKEWREVRKLCRQVNVLAKMCRIYRHVREQLESNDKRVGGEQLSQWLSAAIMAAVDRQREAAAAGAAAGAAASPAAVDDVATASDVPQPLFDATPAAAEPAAVHAAAVEPQAADAPQQPVAGEQPVEAEDQPAGGQHAGIQPAGGSLRREESDEVLSLGSTEHTAATAARAVGSNVEPQSSAARHQDVNPGTSEHARSLPYDAAHAQGVLKRSIDRASKAPAAQHAAAEKAKARTSAKASAPSSCTVREDVPPVPAPACPAATRTSVAADARNAAAAAAAPDSEAAAADAAACQSLVPAILARTDPVGGNQPTAPFHARRWSRVGVKPKPDDGSTVRRSRQRSDSPCKSADRHRRRSRSRSRDRRRDEATAARQPRQADERARRYEVGRQRTGIGREGSPQRPAVGEARGSHYAVRSTPEPAAAARAPAAVEPEEHLEKRQLVALLKESQFREEQRAAQLQTLQEQMQWMMMMNMGPPPQPWIPPPPPNCIRPPPPPRQEERQWSNRHGEDQRSPSRLKERKRRPSRSPPRRD